MLLLVLGIVIFLGVHSVRIAAPGWRDGVIARGGERQLKGIYSLVSLAGLVLIVIGFGMTQADPVPVYVPPSWGRHVAMALMLLAFISFVASVVPGGRIKAFLRHPQLLAVMLWGAAHLLANGDLAGLILFGSFLLWAIVDRIAVGARDADAGSVPAEGYSGTGDVIAVVVGVLLYGLFVWRLHLWLFGVSPTG